MYDSFREPGFASRLRVWSALCGRKKICRQIREGLHSGFAESHAAAVKHTVTKMERTIGMIKR